MSKPRLQFVAALCLGLGACVTIPPQPVCPSLPTPDPWALIPPPPLKTLPPWKRFPTTTPPPAECFAKLAYWQRR